MHEPSTRTALAALEPGWRDALTPFADSSVLSEIDERLAAEVHAGHAIFPPLADRWRAFAATPFAEVRVVIVGQDPYHAPGQAMGLAFSVPRGVRVPPSLRNVFVELERDLGVPRPADGDLTPWAEQGVLLLNSALSVRAADAGSHAAFGWSEITDAAIRAVSEGRPHVAFLLWGRHAQAKAGLIDESRHLVLRAAHPSPLSASRGFHGCGHFSQVDTWLRKHGETPISWSL